jgi:Leucine-rich repeat (LRR) protein
MRLPFRSDQHEKMLSFQIKTIPPTVKNLTNLVKLSLIDNLIEELPDEIGMY